MTLYQLQEKLSLLFGLKCTQEKHDLILWGPNEHELIRIGYLNTTGKPADYILFGVGIGNNLVSNVHSVEEG